MSSSQTILFRRAVDIIMNGDRSHCGGGQEGKESREIPRDRELLRGWKSADRVR